MSKEFWDNDKAVSQLSKEDEITCMCWDDVDENVVRLLSSCYFQAATLLVLLQNINIGNKQLAFVVGIVHTGVLWMPQSQHR